jgi:hypothetical protein
METCEVTFDETQPCNSSVFECAGDDEVGKKIFEDEEDDAGEDNGDDGEAPATLVPSTSTTMTTVQDGPSPTPPTIQEDQVEATTEGGLPQGERHRGEFKLIILLLAAKFGKESDLWDQLGEKSVQWKEGFYRCIRQKNPRSAICFRSARKLLS